MKEYKTTIPKFKIVSEKTEVRKAKIVTSQNAYDYIKQFYKDDIEIFESFFILLLNKANNTIGVKRLSKGSIDGTVVCTKMLLFYAINTLASTMIIAHNHPSGNTQPSNADIQLTKKIKEALKLCDILLLDHIILTDCNYYSFADEGQI